jgi:hypothetical protein
MFCPSCGAESTIELNYCNRCGANLSAPPMANVQIAPLSLTKPILIIGLVVLFITLGGLGGIVSGTIEMVRAGAGPVSPAIPVLGIPLILTIDIMLLRLLSKLVSASLASNTTLPAKKAPSYSPPELRSSRPSPRLQPGASVTENTTRFLDHEPASLADPVPAKKIDR